MGYLHNPLLFWLLLREEKKIIQLHEAVFMVSPEILNISERTFSDDWGQFLRGKDGIGWLLRSTVVT